MNKILLILTMLISTSAFSGDPLRTWKCNDLVCTMYNDDTFLIGDLLYDIKYENDYLILYAGSKVMLYVKKQKGMGITIVNADDSNDIKHFIVCP